MKYLVKWKGFMVKNDSQKREENLKNTKKLVKEFEREIEVKRQEKLEMEEEKDFRRVELLGRYIAKLLYGQEDEKFKNKYLKKLERNWVR